MRNRYRIVNEKDHWFIQVNSGAGWKLWTRQTSPFGWRDGAISFLFRNTGILLG